MTTRRDELLWAVSLAVLTGITVGAAAYPPAMQLPGTAGTALLATPVLFWLVHTRHDRWTAVSPIVRIAVYFLSLFGGMLVVATMAFLLGDSGLTPLRIGGPMAAFGLAVYLSFFGGADRLRRAIVDRTGIDW